MQAKKMNVNPVIMNSMQNKFKTQAGTIPFLDSAALQPHLNQVSHTQTKMRK